jgi:hypothetical protein
MNVSEMNNSTVTEGITSKIMTEVQTPYSEADWAQFVWGVVPQEVIPSQGKCM